MCGIAGVITFGGGDENHATEAVAAMVGRLRHRGPDGEGRFQTRTRAGGVVALGHARLAIIDLSDAGHQPMRRSGAAITYNGEVYNYRDLRDELASGGSTFRTASDTEVVLAAVERWGVAALDRLSGMFAFGLWDATADRLLLARDRLGVKPLYYHADSRRLVFASELRAIVASGLVVPELDREALWHYLGYQTAPTPATLLRGVRMLEPGTHMEITGDGRVVSRRYWSLLGAPVDNAEASFDAARARVSGLLREAVASHMVSDVPVGVFLSGGIDSGALVSVLQDLGVRPRTFTVGLADAPGDESADARRVAEAFGADHTEIRLGERDLLASLPETIDAIDHPSGDGVNTFVVSKAVRAQGLKVALSGLGGDEIFGGYASFRRLARAEAAARRVGHAPAMLRRAAAGLVRSVGGGRVSTEKAAAVLESDGSLAAIWPVTRQLFPEHRRRRLLAAGWQPATDISDAYAPLLAHAYDDAPDAGVWARVSYAESRGYMHDVLLRDTDQMSMAHGLEVRVPLLDHTLVRHVVNLPDAIKASGHGPKALLAASLPRALPREVAGKPKQGFVLPFDQWMRGAMRGYCEEQLGARGLDGRGLLRPGEAPRLWRGFLSRERGVTWSRVWILVVLNAWLDRLHVRHA